MRMRTGGEGERGKEVRGDVSVAVQRGALTMERVRCGSR